MFTKFKEISNNNIMSNKTKLVNKLETSNKKILEFYEKTKLDFESMNLLIIEIYEKMSNEITGVIDKNMTNDILLNIKSEKNNNEIFRKEILSTINNSVELYKSEISSIKNINTILTNEVLGLREIIMKLNNDLTNSILTKLYEIKQTYVDEMKSILSSKETTNVIKFIELLEKENNILVDKTIKTISEIIPKSNSQNASYIENLITIFKNELKSNLENIKNNDKPINIDEISSIMDNKYGNLLTNIQQTMMLNLNSSEERINKNITELKEFEIIKQNNQEKINNDLSQYLNKFKNSTIKGQQGEIKLINIIQEIYPTAEIFDTSNEGKKCDIMIKRQNKPTILIENKTYQASVSKDEIIKFCRDIEYQNYCGIMFSQTSNISTKENYQIDILNNNILLYVSNCNYDPDKIKMAINIVDHLYPKINDNPNKNATTISNDIMILINDEYKKFINQRDAIKNYITDVNKKLISQLYEMEMPTLSNVLISKFTITQDINLTCDICKKFVGINKKSLSKHKQTCRKKEIPKSPKPINNDIYIETNNDDEDYDIVKVSTLNNENHDETSSSSILDSVKDADPETIDAIRKHIDEFKRLSSEEEIKSNTKNKSSNAKRKPKKQTKEIIV